MAAPKKKRAVYDPMQTPAGQGLTTKSGLLNEQERFVRGRRDQLNRQSPGLGSTVLNAPGFAAAIQPQYDAYQGANQTYDRQQSAAKSGFAQHLGTPGEKTVAPAKKKPGYQPRMTDPVSGAKLQQGRPVAPASAAAPDYTKLKTVQPGVQRAGPTGPFGPQYSLADYGRATANGDVMKKGQPVPPVYSGGLNDRIGLGLDTAGRALGMGFGPPAAPAAPARRPVAPARPSPTMATNPGAFGRAAPMPPSRRAPAPNDATIASVSKGMKNSPGYQDFPPPKKRKG